MGLNSLGLKKNAWVFVQSDDITTLVQTLQNRC
jgi:hypothetical protein